MADPLELTYAALKDPGIRAFMIAGERLPSANLRAASVPAQVRHEPLLVHAFLRARHMSESAPQSFSASVKAAHQLAHPGNLPD